MKKRCGVCWNLYCLGLPSEPTAQGGALLSNKHSPAETTVNDRLTSNSSIHGCVVHVISESARYENSEIIGVFILCVAGGGCADPLW
jgi:hypothetical protein